MSISNVLCASFPDVAWRNEQDCSYKDDIAIFRFELEEGVISPYLKSLLQPNEMLRAERYYRDEDRQRFIYGRGVLRLLLGIYTNQSPERIRFSIGPNKKPALSDNSGWQFNISHSGNWLLIAIARVSVGVDIEKVNPAFSFQDLLPASFSPAEQDYILEGTDSLQRFYELWTRKEALIKATGKGMDNDFSRIPSINGTHTVESSLLGGTGNWLVSSFDVATGYMAAIACQPTVKLPNFYTLNRVLFAQWES